MWEIKFETKCCMNCERSILPIDELGLEEDDLICCRGIVDQVVKMTDCCEYFDGGD